MSRKDSWTVRRSRLPGLVGAGFLAACGTASLAVGQGWAWWGGAAGLAVGACWLLRAGLRPASVVSIAIGERVRLENAAGGLITEGLLEGGSVVTPGLMALRVRAAGARRASDLVLDAWSAPSDDLRRLRVRLLTDVSLRA